MRLFLMIGIVAALLTVAPAAQDTKVKSRTKVRADDAQVVSMTGCLRQDALTGRYTLVGSIAAAGDDLKTKTKVKIDVDRDDTTVKTKTKTDADDAVATAGLMSTYSIAPGEKVNLASHVGYHVQLSAVMVEPGHRDADVTVKDKTTVDPQNARDTTSRTKTKIEVEGTVPGQYTVVSVKRLGGACSIQ